MIINFNLLLVWLPMCKYSLTRLAFHANNLLNQLKRQQQGRQKKNLNELVIPLSSSVLIELPITKQAHQFNLNHGLYRATKPTRFSCFRRKFKQSLADASNQFKSWICEAKLNFINSFLIAVDHCTPLHTICATTITIASGKLKVPGRAPEVCLLQLIRGEKTSQCEHMCRMLDINLDKHNFRYLFTDLKTIPHNLISFSNT